MKLNKFMLGHISVFLGVICMFFVTACSDDEGDDGNPVIPPTLSISPEAADITFSAKATESFTYTVITNQLSWDVKITPEEITWCNVERTSDNQGFKVTAVENTQTTSPSKVNITVTAGDATPISFSATQAAAEPILTPYIVGTVSLQEGSFTAYWKDGVRTILEGESIERRGRAASIAVSGDDIYVAGTCHDGEKQVACYWKNGVKTILDTNHSYTHSIFVSGDDVHIAGCEFKGGNTVACYWKNGVKTELSSKVSREAYSVTVSAEGEVFIAGNSYDYENYREIACYWKDGVRTQLGVKKSSANAIIKSGTDIYVAGHEMNEDESETVACYWKNGIKTVLGINPSTTYSISVQGNDVYVAGCEENENDYIACYWKNGVKTVLGSGAHISHAYSIVVSGDDVYIVGDEWESSRLVARYWKNGVSKEFGDTNIFSTAYSLFVK